MKRAMLTPARAFGRCSTCGALWGRPSQHQCGARALGGARCQGHVLPLDDVEIVTLELGGLDAVIALPPKSRR